MTGDHWSNRAGRHPFAGPSRVPAARREADGSLSASVEVEHARREAAAEWLARHELAGFYDPADLLERAAAVGESVACAEALARRMPRLADGAAG